MFKDLPMFEQRIVAFASSITAALAKQHGVAWKAHQLAAFKKVLSILLAVWIGYFFVIQLYARKLSQIVVPLIDVPLSVFLVAQGVVFVFLTTLWMLGRHALGRHAAVARRH